MRFLLSKPPADSPEIPAPLARKLRAAAAAALTARNRADLAADRWARGAGTAAAALSATRQADAAESKLAELERQAGIVDPEAPPVCAECGEPFTRRRSTGRYCSAKCRQRASRRARKDEAKP
jgi:hypothetical protein